MFYLLKFSDVHHKIILHQDKIYLNEDNNAKLTQTELTTGKGYTRTSLTTRRRSKTDFPTMYIERGVGCTARTRTTEHSHTALKSQERLGYISIQYNSFYARH